MGPPKVSVVMAAYNEERFIREAIDSILNQTFEDFEFIVINDGSTDRTPEILNSYKNDRLKIIHQENMGLTKSLNKGMHLAEGKYIARMDADDISEPARLRKQVSVLDKNKDIVVLATWYSIIDEEGNEIIKYHFPHEPQVLHKTLKKNNIFCHGSIMMRKATVEKVGLYRKQFKYAQDYDLWLRLLASGQQFYAIPEYLFQSRITKRAVVKRPKQKVYGAIAIKEYQQGYVKTKSNLEEIGKMELQHDEQSKSDKYVEAFYQYAIGTMFWEAGYISKSRRTLFKAIEAYPWLLRAWIRLLLSFFPKRFQLKTSSIISLLDDKIKLIRLK